MPFGCPVPLARRPRAACRICRFKADSRRSGRGSRNGKLFPSLRARFLVTLHKFTTRRSIRCGRRVGWPRADHPAMGLPASVPSPRIIRPVLVWNGAATARPLPVGAGAGVTTACPRRRIARSACRRAGSPRLGSRRRGPSGAPAPRRPHGPHRGHAGPHHRPHRGLAGRRCQASPVGSTHNHPGLVQHHDRPEPLGLQQPQSFGRRGTLSHRGHTAAGEHPRQLGRALERQVSSQPVHLARHVVIHRAEPGRFEPPRGPRAGVFPPARFCLSSRSSAAAGDKPAGPVVSSTALPAGRQLNFVCGRCWRTPSR